jgi:hypothetical protein
MKRSFYASFGPTVVPDLMSSSRIEGSRESEQEQRRRLLYFYGNSSCGTIRLPLTTVE